MRLGARQFGAVRVCSTGAHADDILKLQLIAFAWWCQRVYDMSWSAFTSSAAMASSFMPLSISITVSAVVPPLDRPHMAGSTSAGQTSCRRAVRVSCLIVCGTSSSAG